MRHADSGWTCGSAAPLSHHPPSLSRLPTATQKPRRGAPKQAPTELGSQHIPPHTRHSPSPFRATALAPSRLPVRIRAASDRSLLSSVSDPCSDGIARPPVRPFVRFMSFRIRCCGVLPNRRIKSVSLSLSPLPRCSDAHAVRPRSMIPSSAARNFGAHRDYGVVCNFDYLFSLSVSFIYFLIDWMPQTYRFE